MRLYETMLILDAGLPDAEIDRGLGRFTELVTERGGQVVTTDRWGRRRFAQELDGRQEGYYVVVTYSLDPGALVEVDRALPFVDGIVRTKTVRPGAPAKTPEGSE